MKNLLLSLTFLAIASPSWGLGVANGVVTTSKLGGGSVTTSKLHIEALDGFEGKIELTNPGTDAITIINPDAIQSAIYWGSASDDIGAQINWSHNGNLMIIGTNNAGDDIGIQTGDGSRAMTLLDSGNVGIGTTSPGTSLDVNGIATSSGSAYNSQNIIMPDTGDGATSDLTFTPNMGRQRLFCQDANGCVMTFGETAVANGTVTTIINVQATGNTTLTYGAGVALLQGGASWTTMNANDVITLIYNEDAWYEMSRSVN